MGVLMRVVDTESASRSPTCNYKRCGRGRLRYSRPEVCEQTGGLRYELEGRSKIEMRPCLLIFRNPHAVKRAINKDQRDHEEKAANPWAPIHRIGISLMSGLIFERHLDGDFDRQ